MIPRLKIGNDVPSFALVIVREKDRFKHVFICGKTGTGKSEFILNVFNNDSFPKVARIVIDPLGNLSKKTWSITKGQAIYCGLEHPIGLNLMQLPYKPAQIVDLIIEAINQAISLTVNNERLTAKMIAILTDAILFCLREKRLSLQYVREWIARDRADAQTRDGILSRLDLLLKDDDFRQIICGDTIDIARLIEEKQTLILDCKGMGLMKKVFLGTVLVKLLQGYFMYAKVKEYKPIVLYLDEAHNFLDRSFCLVIKEGRNFNFSCLLATQDFALFPPEITHTILSNVGTLIVMRAGNIEGIKISNEFATINGDDVKLLEKYHAYCKTPEGEYIVKLPRPIYVKEIGLPTVHMKQGNTNLKWFDLPSYCFQLDYEPDGAVASDGHNHAPKTPFPSMKGS